MRLSGSPARRRARRGEVARGSHARMEGMMVTTGMTPLTRRPAWQALEAHHRRLRDVHLRQLFADDPGRGECLVAEGAGLYLDYSKHRVTDETLRLLLQLA